MHPNLLQDLLENRGGERAWPPEEISATWNRIRDYRMRYEADAGTLFAHKPSWHVAEDPKATQERAESFTAVPLARDICRLSSQLLFSEEPKITADGQLEQSALDALVESNGMGAFLLDAADQVAAEGYGGIRIVTDDAVNQGRPILTYEPADRVIFRTRYGRFTDGGIVVVARKRDGVMWRLLEDHSPGLITRRLFKGSETRLGSAVGLSEGPPEFRDLRDEQRTGISRSTLIRWDNAPGAVSDLVGLESLLDELDEAETIGRRKLRASKPRIFANRRLASENGSVDLDSVILLDDSFSPVERPESMAETVQPRLEASDHTTYVRHVRELALSLAGYSLASYGLDHGGSADSGKALKLRQSRTLLTLSGKTRMATSAISEACSVALEFITGGVAEVSAELGDGQPVDRLERAQEVTELFRAGLLSDVEAVRTLHPDWSEEQIRDERERITLAQDLDERDALSRAQAVINS